MQETKINNRANVPSPFLPQSSLQKGTLEFYGHCGHLDNIVNCNFNELGQFQTIVSNLGCD